MNYTLSLHDALPIFDHEDALHDMLGSLARMTSRDALVKRAGPLVMRLPDDLRAVSSAVREDRKSTRLNSSHVKISYDVFCLKKKKLNHHQHFHTTTL